jgi:hypothetical protein
VAHAGLDDNGYDTDGNKISDEGGNKTDYIYSKSGELLKTIAVSCLGPDKSFTFEGREFGPKPTFRNVGVKSYIETGACIEDNSIANFFISAKAIQAVFTGLRFVSSAFVYRAGGESTFKLGLLDRASGYMIRFERHSGNLIGGGKGYFTHFNFDFAKNYHWVLNPFKWGKFKF